MNHHQILRSGMHTMSDLGCILGLPFPQTDLPDAWCVESQRLFQLLKPYHHPLHRGRLLVAVTWASRAARRASTSSSSTPLTATSKTTLAALTRALAAAVASCITPSSVATAVLVACCT